VTKFAVKVAIDGEERVARMRENMRRSLPRFEPKPPREGTLAVCGYGPSLADTWKEIKTQFICTTSGAHDFLVERGLNPLWHVEFDPRPHKATFLRKPRKQTTYCISSVCHPDVFAALSGRDVVLWHAGAGDMLADCDIVNEFEKDGIVFRGGSTAGLRAVAIGHALGFRKFALFGLDCSYSETATWAGPHASKEHDRFRVECNGKEFWTSDAMLNAAEELFTFLLTGMPGSTFVVHGDNLFAERVRMLAERGMETALHHWWRPGEGFKPTVLIDGVEQSDRLISDEYRALLCWLHEASPDFGTAGDKQAQQVGLLMRMLGTTDVLDYGCGKGNLISRFPGIKGYDPGVPKFANDPQPADLVICTRVLEYVEETSVNAVMQHIARLAKRMVYFEIGVRPREQYISETPVAITRDTRWWFDVISQYFELVGPTFGGSAALRLFCVPREK